LREDVLGADGILASLAKSVLDQLGTTAATALVPTSDTELLGAVEAELGTDWQKFVRPAFDANKAVLLDDRWALYREDLARAAAAIERGEQRDAD
ncbi:hypothetical protein QP158_11295, partial [Streptococcus agalactiae]